MKSRPKDITIISPYYENENMFLKQVQIWESYPREILSKTDFIVVDDCSSTPLIDIVRRNNLNKIDISLKIYRLKQKADWNWQSCKNLGAHFAETEWLILLDIDHAITADHLVRIYETEFDQTNFFTFARRNVKDGRMCDTNHPNIYFITKELFWKVGGHDESFAGTYGNDGEFRKRLLAVSTEESLTDLPLQRYTSSVIFDCTSHTLPKRNHEPYNELRKMIRERKEREGNFIKTLSFPWERSL